MTGHQKRVGLDDLAAGRLPKNVLAGIERIQLTIGDLAAWEASKPKVRIQVTDGHTQIDLRLRFSNRKLAALVAAFLGMVGAGAKILADNPALLGAIVEHLAGN